MRTSMARFPFHKTLEGFDYKFQTSVDPKVIPYGTHILLIWPDGTQHSYIAEDCGGGVNGNHIDVFLNDHLEDGVFPRHSYDLKF